MANIIEITDLSAPALEPYCRLTEAQLRARQTPEKGLFIAEGVKVIGHALDAGCEPVSMLMPRRHAAGKARALVERCGAPVYVADDALLETLTGYALTRGVLCAMRRPALPAPEDICADARRVVVLENIVDPTNVGAIMRSAAALGVDAALLTPGCCDPLNRRAARVSMGAVFQIPWTRLGDTAADWPGRGLARLRAMGFATAAMALDSRAVTLDELALSAPDRLAVVLGTEGDGLAPSTIAACDMTVRIPMSRGVDSLNVAAAGAVAFWALRAEKGC